MLTNYFGDMSFLGEKNEDKVYVNQDESLTDLQTLIKYSFRLNFLHESLMNLISLIKKSGMYCYRTALFYKFFARLFLSKYSNIHPWNSIYLKSMSQKEKRESQS